MRMKEKFFCVIAAVMVFTSLYSSDWSGNRVWIGPEYWANPLPDWKLHLTARKIWYEAGETYRAMNISLKQNWRLSTNTSIELDISRQHSFDHYLTDTTLLFNIYW